MDLENRLRAAEHAIGLLQKLISQRGPVTVEGDVVRAGDTVLNGDTEIVDAVYDATLFGSTIFLGNVRIATRASMRGSADRALGTTTNEEVTRQVFVDGRVFRGTTQTLGKDWVIVYVPLCDSAMRRIGMLAAYRELVAKFA